MAISVIGGATAATGLPEGAKALITQGLSSTGAFTYTPTTALPAGSYMLSATPCETVYGKVSEKIAKSNSGKVLINSASPISSIKFKADQEFDFNDMDTFEVPNPLHYSYTYNTASNSYTNTRYLGASLGVHYAIQYTAGQGAYVLYRSLDKVHWQTTFINADSASQGEPFRNLLVTVGSSTIYLGTNRTNISVDGGIVWSQYVHNINFQAISYGNGIFVGLSGTTLYTSTNGYTWTNRGAALTPSYSMFSVIHDGAKFVAASYGFVYTSTDGITWTQRTTTAGTTAQAVYALTYSGSLYMLIDNAGNTYTSPDAITWTAKTSFGSGPRNLIWFAGKFAAITTAAVRTYKTTTDGTTWTDFTFTTQFGLNTIQTLRDWAIDPIKNEVFLFSETSNGTEYVAYGVSSNLTTWTTWGGANSRGSFVPYKFAKVGNDYYIADYYSMYKTSDLGKTWTAWSVLTTTNYNLQAFTYADGKFFGVGQTNGITYSTFWSSNDAITWTYGTFGVMDGNFSSAYSDGKYLYTITITNSNQYAARYRSTGLDKSIYLGTATQCYFAGTANGITFYSIGSSNLQWINWDAQSGYQYGQVMGNYATAAQGAAADNRVFYIDGLYVFIGQTTGASGTVQFFKVGRTHDRMPISIPVYNVTKFIGEINETLYFLGSRSTTTYNTGDYYPIMKVSGINAALQFSGAPLSMVFETTKTEIRPSNIPGLDSNVNQVSNLPGINLAMQYNDNEYRGIAIMRNKPSVFSLYSLTDTVYN